MRKVTRRLIPFLAILYIVSFVDRVNMGFAALTMNKQLGLTPVMFGTASGIFFLSYFLFEVPSNLILHRVGARLWIARVMVSWGIVSSATAFVTTAHQLYTLRFLLGAAEAGFFPGVILYLTYWFPARWRARVTAGFMAAIPVASLIGAPISAALLNLHGFLGLAGWQWMFLLEGVPSVLLGFVVLKRLTNSVSQADWLTAEEKKWLTDALENEKLPSERQTHVTAVRALLDLRIVALGLIYLGLSAGLYGVELWLPLILKGFGFRTLQIGFLAAVPYGVAILGMWFWARRSDRLGERTGHVVGAAFLGAAGFIAAAFAHTALLSLLCITVAVTGIMATRPPFWSLPTQILAGQAAAAGIALVNAIGNLGGFVGPYVMGWATELTGNFHAGLLAIAALLLLSCGLTFIVTRSRLPGNKSGPGQNYA